MSPAILRGRTKSWIAALGGSSNITTVEGFASGRLRVELVDESKVDEQRLIDASVRAVMKLPDRVVHLLVGPDAKRYAGALQETING
jgi:N-acetylglucosamine PTS system EIICBA or EIICB component